MPLDILLFRFRDPSLSFLPHIPTQELLHCGSDVCSTLLLRVSYCLSPAWVTLPRKYRHSRTYITQKDGTHVDGEQFTSPTYNGVVRIAGNKSFVKGFPAK